MTRAGINVIRQTTGGLRSRNVADYTNRRTISQSTPPTLQRAVVYDVICDASLHDEDFLNTIAGYVDNAELVDVMPVNSVIARIVSDQSAVGASIYTILLPFFSSHFQLPVKPGEHVDVIYRDYENTGNKVGYWLSRTTAQGTVEDPNYTHLDRQFDPTLDPSKWAASDQARLNQGLIPPEIGFPNGAGGTETVTIRPEGSITNNPYDTILSNSTAAKFVTFEPVPRWRKRPQECVIQGSNNALIMLGEDRNGPVVGATQEVPIDIKGQAGTIDLVVGRGRFPQPAGVDPRLGGGPTNPPGPASTAPLITRNKRSYTETDKAAFRTNKIENPNEGNPDPKYDAARIYITQQSMVDVNYGLSTMVYPLGALPVVQPFPQGNIGRSYVVNKADNIRIIGRKDPVAGINGSVLIIREGTADVDLAYMYMNQLGYIQIEASRIFLGKSITLQEPYLKYSVYRDTITRIEAQIAALVGCLVSVMGAGGTLNNALAIATAAPNGSIASLNAAAVEIASAAAGTQQQINAELGPIQGNLLSVRSTKIFGE